MASRFTSHQIPCVSFFLFPPCMCPGWCEISDGMKYDCECVRIFRYFNISNLSNEIIFDRVEIFRKEIFLFFKYCYLSKYKYKEKDIIFESYAFFEDIFLQNFIFDRFKETSTRDDPWSESLSKIPHAITRHLRERRSTKYFKGNHRSVMPVRQVETGVNIFIDRCPFPQMETGTRNHVSQLTKISKKKEHEGNKRYFIVLLRISYFLTVQLFLGYQGTEIKSPFFEGHPRRSGLMTVSKESKPRFLSTVLR